MKATDLRPEHFTNGKNFNKEDFDAWIEASVRMSKVSWTRYLPIVLVGCALGLVCSQFVGGFIGNILAIVCALGGLIIGGNSMSGAGKDVKYYADKLGLDKQAVAEARKNCKNGVTAWSAEEKPAE